MKNLPMNASLNPFEFRAGLERNCDESLRAIFCLNPFEFRAGLELNTRITIQRRTGVLIPLNSGLAWSRAQAESIAAMVS